MIGTIMSHKEKGILEHWNMHPDVSAWSMRFYCCGAYCYGLFSFKNFFENSRFEFIMAWTLVEMETRTDFFFGFYNGVDSCRN